MKEKEEQSKRQTEPVYSKTYTVEPAEGNGQQELPLTLLAKRILEVATLHAESWGVGYSTLIKTGKYGYSPGSPSKCTVIRSSTSIILYKHGSKGITSIFHRETSPYWERTALPADMPARFGSLSIWIVAHR